MATSFHVNVEDLMFILRQIKISEAHSGGLSLTQAIQNEYGGTVADANLVPFGLRTVDGSLNNLAPGQEGFGAADQTFSRMLDPIYVNDADGDSIDFNGPAPGGEVVQGNYGIAGNVVDADPRTISNLIVDQSVNNPAAILAALKYAGIEGADASAALAAIQAANVAVKAAQLAASAVTQTALDALQDVIDIEIAELAVAQDAYDTAVAADIYAGPANLASATQVAADALVVAINVVGSAIFGQNIDATDIANADAAVVAANAAVTAAAAAATALSGLTGHAQALAVESEMISLQFALQTYAAGLTLGESVGLIEELLPVSEAADAAYANAALATAVTDVVSPLVDPGGAVATTLSALNTAQAELLAAQNALIAAQNAAADVIVAKENLITVANDHNVQIGADGGLEIPNLSPDIGLSPAFNSWMTFFGQFFDHGLDLVPKAANGTVYIPLEADDPLIAGADGVFGTADDLDANLRFMAVTRAAIDADGNSINLTTPFVDQNQTYTSHASHQVFLREYIRADLNDGRGVVTLSTGALLDGTTASGSLNGAIANWGEVKAQAREMLGIELTDMDVGNVPWLRTDAYGELILSADGYAQVITGVGADGIPNTADDVVVSGTSASPVNPTTVGALRTGHAFLDDIAHHAAPGMVDHDHNPATPMVMKTEDVDVDLNGDGIIDAAEMVADDGISTTYDGEMLNAHFITGDGRGNENIALSAVHSVFHSEHNRILEVNKHTILETGDMAFINEWLLVDLTAAQVAAIPTDPAALATFTDTLVWDGERMFQAARFTTEMQYQHLVFEEFARRIQPAVDPFVFTHSPDIDAAIVAEFAHTVYRFGHSMLVDTVDRFDNDLQLVNGTSEQITLIDAFLNPQAFVASGASLEEVISNIVRGATRDVGNEMDEFVVPSLQSNLLGLPLDLAAINIARGRDTGIPSLNEARKQFYSDYGLADIKPYTSWIDFAQHIKNPASIINFIAAYGTHATITGVDTIEGKRAAAMQLLADYGDSSSGGHADAVAFLNATGVYNTIELGGMNNVDFWIGGLAEELNEFGGMLGSTFNLVFEFQMEKLQTGDRFYYLSRTQGTNLLNQLEPNTFTDLVMRNSTLGEEYATHLNPNLFVTPDHIFELDGAIAQTDYNAENTASQADGGFDPVHEDPFLQLIDPKVVRVSGTVGADGHYSGGYLKYSGGEHVVLGGTEGNDTLIADKGIDGIWGDGGDDYINAGMESDNVFGGAGDDIIEDPFGDDVLRGEDGNDVISAGSGLDLIFGGDGQDYIIVGQDDKEAFGDEGDDFILGGTGNDFLLGNEGNDWIEGGDGFDVIAGDNSQLFFNSSIVGHDVAWGQSNDQDYDLESGDDIALSGPGIQRFEGMFGFDWAIGKYDVEGVKFDFAVPIFTTIVTDILKDRFDQIEAASGWVYDDILDGDDRGHTNGGSSAPDSVPVELFSDHVLNQEGIDRIDGLRTLLNGGLENVAGNNLVAMNSIFGTQSATFQNGNILLGGDGNDALRGRGGYDILDGDAWLNVRIKIMHDGVEYSAESMNTDENVAGEFSGFVFNVVDGVPDLTSKAFEGRTLNSLMLDGTINPGNLSIVREIKYDDTNVSGAGRNVDTAVFQGTRDEYDIEGITQNQNTGAYTGTARDVDGDGFIKVRDRDTGAIGATVVQIIDGVATQVTLNSRGALTDDIDLLRNMEQLQFADQTIVVGVPANSLATGTVTIDDQTPIVGQVLTATLSNFADADGLTLDTNGLPVGLNFEWQTTEVGSNAGWTTIQTSLTYTVRPVDPGHILRAVAVFKDDTGVTERIASAPTADPTAPFIVAENSAAGTVVGLTIPFSVDYDPQPINGQPPADVDLATIHHEIDPNNNAGGRFTVISNGFDINGFPRFSLVVNPALNNTGPLDALDTRVLLNYEAPVHTPANQSHQNPDNQYEVVINTYDVPGGTLVAVRQFTVLLTDVAEGTADQAPVLDLVGIATLTNGSFREEFTADSYSGTDQPTPANTPWATDWVENDGFFSSPNFGDIQIVSFNGSNQLRFDSGIDGGEFIARQVDLGGATSATLSFNYFMNDLEGGENIVVEARLGNGNWVEVGTQDFLNGSNQNNGRTVSGVFDFALPQAVIGAETEIRFRAEGSWNSNDAFYIDNVNIAYSTATTTTAPPYGYDTAYTENGTAVAIADNPAIADVDNSFVMGATVKLTNAQAQDALSIAGTLPAGITMSFGPAVAGEITMYLAGPTSFAAMQTAIGQVRFENTGDNPTAIARIINVTVNDGEKESNIATATINVTEVPDPFVAGDDRIVTNIGNGPAIIVPEWALLDNDIDPDGPAAVADITAISGASSLTATLAPAGSVSIVDTGNGGGNNGGSFNYSANYGAQSDVANVQVVRDTQGAISGNNGNDILVGDGGSSTFDGGAGNDIIFAGAGDDTIIWSANNNGTTDGHDFVDGGDHSNPATSGDVVITGNGGVTGNRLNFTDSTSGNETISRAVALNPAETATLSFTWRLDDTDGPFFFFPGDDTDVQAFDGTNWVTIATLDGGIAEDTDHNFSQALTAPFIGAHTAIRYVSPNLSNGENIYIDNVQIATPSGTYRDEFGTQAYNNSNGTLPWTTSWTESNEPAGADTFVINGNDEDETFRVYSRAAALVVASLAAAIRADAEIIVTRNVDGGDPDADDIIAQLDNVEEIIINTNGGNDTVIPIGNFDPTSLAYNTIRVDGGTGDDTVDISGLASNHRVVLTTDGGNDRIVGGDRAQDMVQIPDGTEEETEETEEPEENIASGEDTSGSPENPEQDTGTSDQPAGQPNSNGGTSDADVLTGTEQGETIMSLGGNDIVFAAGGADNVLAGAGKDMVFGDSGNDRIFGDGGDDFLNGGGGNDMVVGGAGNDHFVAEAGDGNDTYYGDDVDGGTGNDTLDMSAITANISADLGNGYMERGGVYSSETGHDTLWNIENIVTGSGDDIITASNSVNVIDGGDGNDIFRFNSVAAADGDTIASFQPGDKIDLSAFDANSSAAGQQSFTLVSGGITGGGQLAITHEMHDDGDYTVISGNVTGGEDADFKINVRGTHELTASDFNL
jgi:Ca2+-binding RTX toxin-like protein